MRPVPNDIKWTRQTAFDHVVEHLKTMPGRAFTILDCGDRCMYRTTDGNRCAIGALIPDEQYNSNMEGFGPQNPLSSIRKLPCFSLMNSSEDMNFLHNLQRIHDCSFNWTGNKFDNSTALRCFANNNGLIYNELT